MPGSRPSLAQFEHPHAPIRDDSALAPTEDLDREPDGVPHAVIALLVLGSLVVAALLLVLISGHVPRHPGARLVAIIAIVAGGVVFALLRRTWRRPGPHASR